MRERAGDNACVEALGSSAAPAELDDADVDMATIDADDERNVGVVDDCIETTVVVDHAPRFLN